MPVRMRPHWPTGAAKKIVLFAKNQCTCVPEHSNIAGTQALWASGRVMTHTHCTRTDTHTHTHDNCEGFCSFIWDLFARLYLYLCCPLIWSCGGSRNISNYLLNVSPSTQGKHCCGMCVGGSSPYCFIASAMYSHVLMGFSNLTSGLEIMKGDKEHW